jgi:hypothetical protein
MSWSIALEEALKKMVASAMLNPPGEGKVVALRRLCGRSHADW